MVANAPHDQQPALTVEEQDLHPQRASLSPFPSEMEFIRYALDSAAIVAMTDVRGTITFVNSKFCEISGYSRDELIGANHRILNSGIHSTDFFRSMYRRIAGGEVWHGEICNRRKDGSHYWVDTTIVPHVNINGKVDSYTAIRFDISSRHAAEELLRRIVSVDSLTGIPNRRSFQEYLESVLPPERDNPGQVHLALLDVDTFKEINDTFGHDVGDTLLKLVSERLSALSSPDVFVARLGGDEFCLVMTNMDRTGVNDLVQTALAHLREPVPLGSVIRRYSASIGVASFPEHAGSLDELFKAADMALYHSKALGRDQAQFFIPRLREIAERKSELLHAVEVGLDRGQFHLYYQPIVPISSPGALSFEGLLRWNHPDRNLITPAAFLTDMDDPGLQAAIGMFVVEQAFRDMRIMLDQNVPLRRLAINITNADFRSDAFVDRFFELSRETGIPPSKFCIEVTEGVFLGRDFQHLAGRLSQLHAAGVEIALDDFGTGFASLTHLRRMPIDRIKIDRSFISNITNSIEDLAIVRGVIDIAHSMGKVVTAEGVETRAQVELLHSLRCDYYQGWYFSKATPIDGLRDAVRNMPPLIAW
ncbi:putative bifunctional diguanylate cyclase/phosphodiesterase [Ketogulonicigenium vulgare]|uniref:Diguanylate cyclase/phosphodiesterase (GGDEF & EAL domains) with PAS/PAC sensor(S) n=1 Tax=Ketogulonicigenium vulgare (strain WSH-001) TaxID=759362 RepID=F9Y860_KETVW|nr:GGDEF domain-containing phosphodiesterase [Ketogulonicigenium vulgare]AEM42346.1 Diguanylate cyclase/phosphodiesterase (GGDEF & EAL domains) with PAS/PAC sensor(S) [Ketogulonicigenium vulgare WSH-001]AOZ53430.1 Diguanylate cyclase/phosphodiesterase (GGDEF & EAL domains) with PAS/PAC sensor(S) [Ketogulonicigenium vulgare]